MSRMKLLLGIVLTSIILMAQVGGVLAAPASQEATLISGAVQRITLETDPTTGVITVIVELVDINQHVQTVRISQELSLIHI